MTHGGLPDATERHHGGDGGGVHSLELLFDLRYEGYETVSITCT